MKLEVANMKARGGSLVSTLAALALSFAAAGCGSSGNPGTCGVAPCGGDVVGNWKASSACIDRATLDMGFVAGIKGVCADVSLGAVTVTPNGTLSFAADMTFTGTLTTSSNLDLIFPASCFPGVACDALTQVLQTLVGTNGITAVSCAGTNGCTCTMGLTLDIVNDTGTWTKSGTSLALTGPTMGAQSDPYCVQGSSLHMVDLDVSTMMKVVGDVVLTKQ